MKNSTQTQDVNGYSCKVRLFRDEEAIDVKFQKQVTGEWLLDYVCKELNIVEKYYFGLRFTDNLQRRQWLDLTKPLLKQVKDPMRESICFRVRYYPASPETIKEELTRYQLYMQLRRDAYHGRLVPRPCDIPHLCALIIQAELGDHDDIELDGGFTKDIDLMPKASTSQEEKIMLSYRELSGLTPADTEVRFIDKVRNLETYGIDPQPAKDKSTEESLHIGANHAGISMFQNFRRTKLLKWENFVKCNVDGRVVNISLFYSNLDEKHKKQSLKYKCPDEHTAKFLWMNILDQHAFFNLTSHHQAKPIKSGGLFKRSNKFRFSGRVYDEVVNDSNKIARMPPSFIRASSLSLNRSLSIRSTSSRRLAPPSNRYSMGAMPHSQSLPIGFKGDLISGDQSSHLALGLSSSEVPKNTQSNQPNSPSEKTGNEGHSHPPDELLLEEDRLTQTRYDETDLSDLTGNEDLNDSQSACDSDDHSIYSGIRLLSPQRSAASVVDICTPSSKPPLFSSTPVSVFPSTTSHSSNQPMSKPQPPPTVLPGNFSEPTINSDAGLDSMLDITTQSKPNSILEPMSLVPTETVNMSAAPKFPPEIIITEDDEEEGSRMEQGNPITISANNNNSPIEPPVVDGLFVYPDDVDEEIHVQFAEPISTEFVEQDDISADVEPSDPLSESTRQQLKLSLDKLGDMSDSSTEPTPKTIPPVNSSLPTASPNQTAGLVFKLLLTLWLLLVAAVVVFETNLLRDNDFVSSLDVLFYKPLKATLFGLNTGSEYVSSGNS